MNMSLGMGRGRSLQGDIVTTIKEREIHSTWPSWEEKVRERAVVEGDCWVTENFVFQYYKAHTQTHSQALTHTTPQRPTEPPTPFPQAGRPVVPASSLPSRSVAVQAPQPLAK